MAQTSYSKAPIVEAMIDFRFPQPLSPDELEKSATSLAKIYDLRDPGDLINYNIDPSKNQIQVHPTKGFRFSSFDQTEITVIRQIGLTVSLLAPYSKWEKLLERAQRDWRNVGKSLAKRQISRLAIRYINRFDIPVSAKTVKIEEYFKIYVYLPPEVGDEHRIEDYVAQVWRNVGDDCRLIINTGSAQPALPDHVSFLLDFEVFKDLDAPISDSKTWYRLNEMRKLKNHMFESLITDKARALIR